MPDRPFKEIRYIDLVSARIFDTRSGLKVFHLEGHEHGRPQPSKAVAFAELAEELEAAITERGAMPSKHQPAAIEVALFGYWKKREVQGRDRQPTPGWEFYVRGWRFADGSGREPTWDSNRPAAPAAETPGGDLLDGSIGF